MRVASERVKYATDEKKKKKMLKRFRIDRNLSRQRRFEIIPRAFSDYRGSKSLLFALLTD